MKLKNLINSWEIKDKNINILGISEDSKEIKKNYIYFYKNKKKFHKKYIEDAINNGAKLIIYSGEIIFNKKKYISQCQFYKTNDINNLMSVTAKKFYNIDDKKIKIIGITGTNGKSTIANYIAQLMKFKNEKCGIIGTLGNGIYPNLIEKKLTTPNIIDINRNISLFSKKNTTNLVIEVSSHGIKQKRIQGIKFDTVVFSNLTHDHLDYHKTMKDYYDTKLMLFTEYQSKRKVICIDNYYGKKIYKHFKNEKNIKTVSLVNKKANYYSTNIKHYEDGIRFTINSKYGSKEVKLKLYGEFTIENILLAIASLVKNKLEYNTYINNLSRLKPVEGRMNKFYKKKFPTVFIDFAHTPEAIKKLLNSIKKHYPDNKIITVFGCGGDRDTKKRKIMGKIVSKFSDEVIITSDNPRNEDPAGIANDIVLGIPPEKHFEIILKRSLAIRKCLNKNNSEKIALILGKGHEDYQDIKNKKIKYKDSIEVLKILNK